MGECVGAVDYLVIPKAALPPELDQTSMRTKTFIDTDDGTPVTRASQSPRVRAYPPMMHTPAVARQINATATRRPAFATSAHTIYELLRAMTVSVWWRAFSKSRTETTIGAGACLQSAQRYLG